MPKFLPTIDIEPTAVTRALLNGNLKLQTGQWIDCGGKNPSRFVKASSTTIYAIHPEGACGSGRVKNWKFLMLCGKTPNPLTA